jgi:hypothetical protein
MAESADLFGVTRQRIAALLRPSIEGPSIAFTLTLVSGLAAL